MNIKPPIAATRFLRWFCTPELADEIEGDLCEEFDLRLQSRGKGYAMAMYWFDVLGFFRPAFIKKLRNTFINPPMLRNYVVLAYRNMSKKPLFTLINTFGLAAGLACVIVIAGYVSFIKSYDRFHPDAGNLYRVTMKWINDGNGETLAKAVPAVASALDKKLHSVKQQVRVYPYSGLVSKDGTEKLRETRFCFADSMFFNLFAATVQHGSLDDALIAPFSVVLTERMALRHYGTTDVVGQELLLEDERGRYRFNVVAVIDNYPQNSHMNPDFIASLTTLDKIMPWYNNWHYPPMFVYLQAADGYDAGLLQEEVNKVVQAGHPPYIKAGEREYFVQPVQDIYLYSNLVQEWQANGNVVYIRILLIIGGFILFLACINYINLATARSVERSREVGMRKVMGAVRPQLIGQFLGESIIMTTMALVVAVGLAELAFRFYLNEIIEKQLTVSSFFTLEYVSIAAAIMIALALVAGLYPAMFLLRFRPASVLKGNTDVAGGGNTLRRSLVVLQFAVSCMLIVGMLVIQDQVSYMRGKRLGFDQDQLVAIRLFDRKDAAKAQLLKDLLLREEIVKAAAVSSTFPLKDGFNSWPVTPEGLTPDDRKTMKSLMGDVDIVKTLGLDVTLGRSFSHESIADTSQSFILNEAAVKALNWTDPVDRSFELTFYANTAHYRKGKVIGVVKDFHFESLYNRIDPLVILVCSHLYYSDYMLVRIGPGDLVHSVNVLRQAWKTFSPDKPFEFSLAGDDLNALYQQEVKLSRLFIAFTVLSIIISCLGLFGLSAYSLSRRTKEIGIRKVLGASTPNLFGLLSKEYLVLISVAHLIAWPAAWWFGNQWLSTFAYRVDMPLALFVISITLSLVFGLLSISFHVVKASLVNPSSTLRIE